MKNLQESIFSRIANKVTGQECNIWDFAKAQNASCSTDWLMLVIPKWHEQAGNLVENELADILGPIKDNGTKHELLSPREDIEKRFEDFVFNNLLNEHGRDIVKNNQKSIKFAIVMAQYNDPLPGASFSQHFAFCKSGFGIFLEGGAVVTIGFKEKV